MTDINRRTSYRRELYGGRLALSVKRQRALWLPSWTWNRKNRLLSIVAIRAGKKSGS